ncbi:mitochondrial carrier domain-containing protein [Melampsora americana]|nr:mitochondrial carrier domain-containing protein [Melampsora americana]
MTSNSNIETNPTSPRILSHSLRPYYQPKQNDQNGISHYLNQNNSSSSSSSNHQSIKELQLSFQTKPSNSFNLNSSRSFLSDLDMEFNSNQYTNDLPHLLKTSFNSGFMGFTSTAMVMPFEVGKTLMQVQWIPKDDQLEENLNNVDGSFDDLLNDESNQEDEDDETAYFTETRTGPRISLASSSRQSIPGNTPKYQKPRSNQSEDRVQPEYILPITVQGGVTDMIKQIFRWRGEGFIALWKGQLTTFITDTLSSFIQPLMLSGLSFLFSNQISTTTSSLSLPLEHHAYPTLPLTFSVTSYLLTGLLLSPLDLIRTRLIVQSSQLRYRKYSGPIDALRQILKEEGGWSGIYFHSNLILPTILDNILRPAFHLSTPLLIERVLKIDRLERPVLHGLAGLGLASVGLLFILPIETVRKRLQLQSRAKDPKVSSIKPCVILRPKPYAGIVEAVYRILTEETSSPPIRQRRKSRSKSNDETNQNVEKSSHSHHSPSISSGLRQLYRGFNVGLTANVVAFVLGLLGNPLESGSSGWAEV